ncbi:hypothetical protein K493DRAFT_360555 [Basidiobolus meristosporus CBS 931.73]|uniref:Carbohydrate-binding domain-containing protein n=1 Tax=Basidiobolus meristosporus CBS 931.73 TaxID=1314790 RepID=A0A1Y1XGP5_9FUNG|nr:hypothetical protein K493DRAFT_360555 [Basidiobolus meristosporus CBS 931.73]|eukprot:ORX84915.1 hypothetical protein K493DRAFT_360555 [Basidiobolus meristosporus CBS 931.73]
MPISPWRTPCAIETNPIKPSQPGELWDSPENPLISDPGRASRVIHEALRNGMEKRGIICGCFKRHLEIGQTSGKRSVYDRMNLQNLNCNLVVLVLWIAHISCECILPPIKHYAIPATLTAPRIDGSLDDVEWAVAPWTEEFVDALALSKSSSSTQLKTRAKMLWDENFIYVAAQLFDPFIIANLTRMPELQDIFDNTFEMLIDTDRTHHQLKRIQINPLGVYRALQYDKPPMDGGRPSVWKLSNQFESAVLNTSEVHQLVNGGLDKIVNVATNRETQSLWNIEWAIPINVLKHRLKRDPHSIPPYSSFQFMRSGWPPMTNSEGSDPKPRRRRRYISTAVEKLIPQVPYLQTWSPIPGGVLEPEWWGTIEFLPLDARPDSDTTYPPYEARTRFALMQIYRAQRARFDRVGQYTDDLTELRIDGPRMGECTDLPVIETNENDTKYEARIYIGNGRVGHIRQDRYIWFDSE